MDASPERILNPQRTTSQATSPQTCPPRSSRESDMNDTMTLNDGRPMPRLGFGVWQVTPAETRTTVSTALQAGFRLIDTAAGYENEKQTGEALRDGPTPRGEVFVTTKLRNAEHGYDQALKSFDVSMNQLGLDYLDLYLIHWPVPSKNLFVETWRALARLKQEGRVRSIGVSNFTPQHLQRRAGRNRHRAGAEPGRTASRGSSSATCAPTKSRSES